MKRPPSCWNLFLVGLAKPLRTIVGHLAFLLFSLPHFSVRNMPRYGFFLDLRTLVCSFCERSNCTKFAVPFFLINIISTDSYVTILL